MSAKTTLTAIALRKNYVEAVNRRAGRTVRVPKKFEALLNGVAEDLGDPRLSLLFVEAQFAAMPTDWCIQQFKRPYPPFNVILGGDCMGRYEEYKSNGYRVPI